MVGVTRVSISGQSWQLVDARQALAEGLASTSHFATCTQPSTSGRQLLVVTFGTSLACISDAGSSHMDELGRIALFKYGSRWFADGNSCQVPHGFPVH